MPSCASTNPRPPRTPLLPYTTLFRSLHLPRLEQVRAPWEELARRDDPCVARRLQRRALHSHLRAPVVHRGVSGRRGDAARRRQAPDQDRKSTRLNSSHGYSSYAVLCFNEPPTAENSTPSLHDALPISPSSAPRASSSSLGGARSAR